MWNKTKITVLIRAQSTQLHLTGMYFSWNKFVADHKLLSAWLLERQHCQSQSTLLTQQEEVLFTVRLSLIVGQFRRKREVTSRHYLHRQSRLLFSCLPAVDLRSVTYTAAHERVQTECGGYQHLSTRGTRTLPFLWHFAFLASICDTHRIWRVPLSETHVRWWGWESIGEGEKY
jgi:hypothetical protein